MDSLKKDNNLKNLDIQKLNTAKNNLDKDLKELKD